MRGRKKKGKQKEKEWKINEKKRSGEINVKKNSGTIIGIDVNDIPYTDIKFIRNTYYNHICLQDMQYNMLVSQSPIQWIVITPFSRKKQTVVILIRWFNIRQ